LGMSIKELETLQDVLTDVIAHSKEQKRRDRIEV
jgi:hypothetical protein